jgi:hypothetical protein
VKLVRDKVKNTETIHYSLSKSSTSKINRASQNFDIQFLKTSLKADSVDIFITTNRQPFQPEFDRAGYLLVATEKVQVTLENIRQVPISENSVVSGSNTTYQTTFNHVPVTTTTQKTVNDVPVTETKTEVQVVQSQVPVQNHYQQVTNNNYIAEKFKISVAKETLEKICSYHQFKLRLYNQENDFWNIDFNTYNVTEIKNLLHNKVLPQNISHN